MSKQGDDVEGFLASVKLEKYVKTFLDNGVDDLEIVLELDDKHLEQMSIPLGHKLKIMKRIKDIRRERGMSVLESRQGARPQRQEVDALNTSDPRGAKRQVPGRMDLEELPDPTNGAYTAGTTLVETQHYTQGTTGKLPPSMHMGGSYQPHAGANSSLLEGEYDEAASHQQFLEALNAWRTGGTAPPTQVAAAKRTVVGQTH